MSAGFDPADIAKLLAAVDGPALEDPRTAEAIAQHVHVELLTRFTIHDEANVRILVEGMLNGIARAMRDGLGFEAVFKGFSAIALEAQAAASNRRHPSAVTAFEPGAALARVVVTSIGFAVDARGPHAAQRRDFTTARDTAEFVRLCRAGGWTLRFGKGVGEVRRIVAAMDSDGGSA